MCSGFFVYQRTKCGVVFLLYFFFVLSAGEKCIRTQKKKFSHRLKAGVREGVFIFFFVTEVGSHTKKTAFLVRQVEGVIA